MEQPKQYSSDLDDLLDVSTELDDCVGSTRSAKPSDLSMEFVSKSEFDLLVTDKFNDVRQEQLVCFMQARWPKLNCDPIIFKRGARLVGACIVLSFSLPWGLGGMSVLRWGPLLHPNNADNSDELANIIELLVEEFAKKRGHMLSISPAPEPSDYSEYDCQKVLQQAGFSEGVQLPAPARYLVNLQPGADDIRSSFGQKWRYNLKKSVKQDLRFVRLGWNEGLKHFDELYQDMLVRKKFPDYSAYSALPTLIEDPTAVYCPEMFLVYEGDQILAGAAIFTAGETATYLYGATNDKALPLNAGYFIHWKIIQWLKENTRAKWYDLGGSDGNQGLHQFKKGMVGKLGEIVIAAPVYNFAHTGWSRFLGNSVYAAREVKASIVRKLFELKDR